MRKFVFLKIFQGDFDRGFPTTLKIASPDLASFLEVELDCELPPNSQIPIAYENWIEAYKRSEKRLRIKPKKTINKKRIDDAAKQLKSNMRTWLSSSTHLKFQRLRETLYDRLETEDEIFVLIQTHDELLKRLPWQEWDLFRDRFPKAEIALSPPEIENISQGQPRTGQNKVKILSILGDRTEIDIEKDKELIKSLPQADTEFLIEPDRQQFSDKLWEEDWDILFFAGHSMSEGESGIIYLNPEDKLPIEELRNSLRRASDRGLQLAIFNSCDGLKLAEYLAELNIPQIIVMREPVPDKVAQLFLEYFLQAYSGGEPLYLAVRQARSRLETIEKEVPGATWIPIIYQKSIQEPVAWPKSQQSDGNSQSYSQQATQNRRINWQCNRTLEGHSDCVTSVAIHPNGTTFATGGLDKKIILWDLETGKVKQICKVTEDTGQSGKILDLSFSPDGSILASTSYFDGTIKIWDANNLTLKRALGTAILTTQITSITFTPDGQYIAGAHCLFIVPEIRLWHLKSQQVKFHLKEHQWEVCSMKFSLDGRILVTGSYDGTIKIWDWKTETVRHSLNRPQPSGVLESFISWADTSLKFIYCVDINPNGNLIVGGNSDGIIQIWQSESIIKPWTVDNSRLMRILTEHSGCVRAIKFSPDGELLASAGEDCTIRMWNPYTGDLLQTLKGHKNTIKDIVFSPDGKSLVSVSDDKTIKIWQRSPQL